jgi:threonine/homoserine/homoserine lactone efflux protein
MHILPGIITGIAYVAAPGPITVETLRQGMKGGLSNSLAVQIGSAIGLIVYAMLALFGAGLVLQDAIWQLVVGVSGMILLFHLGITTIRTGRDLAVAPSERVPGRSSRRRAFWTGAGLSLANPLDIVFWLSMGSRVLSDPEMGGLPFLAGFFAGCLLSSLGVALFGSLWKSRLTPKTARVVSWICGLALVGFGLRLGFSSISLLNI